jgi:hypothetical protein
MANLNGTMNGAATPVAIIDAPCGRLRIIGCASAV